MGVVYEAEQASLRRRVGEVRDVSARDVHRGPLEERRASWCEPAGVVVVQVRQDDLADLRGVEILE